MEIYQEIRASQGKQVKLKKNLKIKNAKLNDSYAAFTFSYAALGPPINNRIRNWAQFSKEMVHIATLKLHREVALNSNFLFPKSNLLPSAQPHGHSAGRP